MVKKPSQNEPHNNKIRKRDDEIVDKVRTKPGELPSKQFEPRNSLLTDLWEDKNVLTIYRIFVAVLVGLLLNTAASDYLHKGEIKLGFSLILTGFANFHLLILIWIGMFLSSFAIYFGFKFWATIRVQLAPRSTKVKLWDKIWLVLYISFCPCFMCVTTTVIHNNGLAIAAAFAVLSEMTRFLMKLHAFVRSNAPRVLKYKLHDTVDQVLYPDLKKFVYFSFSPTLVYQDNYPRSSHIRWNYVLSWFLEMMATIFFISFVLERFYIPIFIDYGLKSFTWQDVIVVIFGNAAPAMLILLNVFYMILHAWQNAFAEMLRFSDRMFYKDWWISASHERYYRTWNVTVHDWLYTYVYKDFYEIVTPKNKIAAKYAVFFLSALFHDYILGFAFRFCLPIVFIQFFGVGVILTFIAIKQNSVGNIFLWYSTALGTSIITVFYTMEYYSRINCPIENVTILSYFTPRLFTCGR